MHPVTIERVDPAQVVTPGDDARCRTTGDRPQRRGQGQIEVEGERVMHDQDVKVIDDTIELPLDAVAERGKGGRNVASHQTLAHRRDVWMARVELGNEAKRDGVIGQGTTPTAQHGDRVAARGQPGRLLIEDGFDATDHRRAGVVQEPDARPAGGCERRFTARRAVEAFYVITGGSSRIKVRSSGFSLTSTWGRPPLYDTLNDSLPLPIRLPG